MDVRNNKLRKSIQQMLPQFVFLLQLAIVFGACSQDVSRNKNHFNANASRYFEKRLGHFDLSLFSDTEQCLLKATIAKDLDALNNWKTTTLVDRFDIRNYHDPYLGFGFSFIRDRNDDSLYFVSSPSIWDLTYHIEKYYTKENDTLYRLNQDRQVIEVDTKLLNGLLRSSAFCSDVNDSKDVQRKTQLAMRLIQETSLGIAFYEFDPAVLMAQLRRKYNEKKISTSDFRNVYDLIDPAQNHNKSSFVYFTEYLGHVVFTFFTDQASCSLNVRLHVIPNSTRAKPVFFDRIKRHPECK